MHNENEVVKMISLISKQMTPLVIAPNLIYVNYFCNSIHVVFLSGSESTGFLSFVYMTFAIGDPVIKRGGLGFD